MIRNNFPLSKKAFSLIEILIAVIIVGVVASIALSQYGVVVERARAKQAEQSIYAIFADLKRKYVENENMATVYNASFLRPSPDFMIPAVSSVVNIVNGESVRTFTIAIGRLPDLKYILIGFCDFPGAGIRIVCSRIIGTPDKCTELGYVSP